MTPSDRAEYIVACIRKGGAMYPEDAEQFLAEHDRHRRAEVLAEVLTAIEDPAHRQQAAAHFNMGSGLGWEAARDIVRLMLNPTALPVTTNPAHQAARGEPGEAASDGGQFDRADWVSCTHHTCRNGEYRAKATERGWHQGPMDAWLCTTHAPGGGQ